MRLTKLELHGFKSFADHMQLEFEPGVTAIVGPNGCGKSNVSDAVRWVLGEQRPRLLRGLKMEEVIFQGSSARRPVNIAEVSLHFSNEDGQLPVAFSEVVVTRRLSRSGASDYLLNRSPCRLRDIHDLDLLHRFEADMTTRRAAELTARKPPKVAAKFDIAHLKAVHAWIFQDFPHHRPGAVRRNLSVRARRPASGGPSRLGDARIQFWP